jgi:hypothetical protein
MATLGQKGDTASKILSRAKRGRADVHCVLAGVKTLITRSSKNVDIKTGNMRSVLGPSAGAYFMI